MFIRLTRVQGPPDAVEKGIANFREKVLPVVKSAPGNAGAVLLVDRKTGSGIGITRWETVQALTASEALGISARAQGAAAMSGSIVNVERYELVIDDRPQPPKAGAFVRVNTVAGAPEKLDNAIKFMKQQVLPAVKTVPGFRALIMGVDRTTGQGIVSTVWDTLADLEASEAKVSSLRRTAADAAGAKDVAVEIFEAALVEIKLTAPV